MAIRASFIFISNNKLTPSAKLVLLCLSNRHNQETGRCDPSLATIAADSGLSERAVRTGLRELEKIKAISTVERKRRTGNGKRNMTNRYRLLRGAESAGGMGQNLPPKQEYYASAENSPKTPSAFDDLAMSIDVLEDSPSQNLKSDV